MKTCDACQAPAETDRSVRCTKCVRTFHLVCVNLLTAEISAEFRAAWICPNCRCTERKGDNTSTPTRSAVLTKAPGLDKNKNRNKKDSQPAAKEGMSTDLSMILTEMRLMRESITDIKQQLKEVKDSNEQRLNQFECILQDFKSQLATATASYSCRMDDFDTALLATAQRLTSLEEAQPDVSKLELRIIKLEEALEHQSQSILRNEIEIVGIPESQNENLLHIIQLVANKIGEPLQDCDLDYVERVGPKTQHSTTKDGQRSRLVVARFVRRTKRDSFLKAARARRNITTSGLGIVGQTDKPIYFNERLSKSNRLLFREARLRAKENSYKFCWTRNGLVLIRKDQGRPAITIRSHADLERHLKHRSANDGHSGGAPITD